MLLFWSFEISWCDSMMLRIYVSAITAWEESNSFCCVCMGYSMPYGYTNIATHKHTLIQMQNFDNTHTASLSNICRWVAII